MEEKWVEEEYYRKDKEALVEFRKEMIRKWERKKVDKIEDMVVDMIEGADKILLKKVKRKIGGEGDMEIREREWMNAEIREGIKYRRDLNRRKRKCKDEVSKPLKKNGRGKRKRFKDKSEKQ